MVVVAGGTRPVHRLGGSSVLLAFKRVIAIVFASAAIVVTVAAAPASSAPLGLSSQYAAGLGTILTDGAGRSVYTFTKDQSGVSNCYDTCATYWPPLLSDSAPGVQPGFNGSFGTTTRTDGSHQVTYNGMPLYYFIADSKPGDVHGYAKNGAWFTVASSVTPTIQIRRDATLGSLLTDAQGKTLYMYTNDKPGVSNCSGECASFWPPLIVDGSSLPSGPSAIAAGLGTTSRDDGSQQVTYNGVPLYYWAKDAKAGDTLGQNVNGVWFVVAPAV
jgi:predicted lipoprotein with Yx(FWY)xxD motif